MSPARITWANVPGVTYPQNRKFAGLPGVTYPHRPVNCRKPGTGAKRTRPGRPSLADEAKAKMVELFREVKSVPEVARRLGHSKSIVYAVLSAAKVYSATKKRRKA